MSTAPTPLAPDFARRLNECLGEADAQGHTDLAYLIELALQIARQRIEAQEAKSAAVDKDLLQSSSRASAQKTKSPQPGG